MRFFYVLLPTLMPFYSTVTCELRSGVVPSLSLSFMSPSSSSSDIACSYVAPLKEPIASFLNVGDIMLAFEGVDYFDPKIGISAPCSID